MKHLVKICSALTLFSGIGHLLLAIIYERQSSFLLILLFGILYTVLGALIAFKGRVPLLVTAGLMAVAAPVATLMINTLGYPVNILALLILIDVIVIGITIFGVRRKLF